MQDVVRFYVSPQTTAHWTSSPLNDWKLSYLWRPVNDTSRCLAFSSYETAEQALVWVVNNAASAAEVWSALGTFIKETSSRLKPMANGEYPLYGSNSYDFMRGRIHKTPTSSCVCVAIVFSAVTILIDQNPLKSRAFGVFVGTGGQGPQGPQFKDLTLQTEEDLLRPSVLRLAALSAIG